MMKLENKIIDALQVAGINGLKLEELSEKLGVDTQDIKTTISKLLKEGKVMQKQNTDGEQFVLRNHLMEGGEGGIGDLNGCPCFHCFKISRCGVRQPDSPIRCRELEDWILTDTS